MIKGLKFRIKEVEGLFYLCSEKKALISCAVIAQLICVFVFAYAKTRFSHDGAKSINTCKKLKIFQKLEAFKMC